MMKIEEAQTVLKQAGDLHRELSQLLYYAPFVFEQDKKDGLIRFIQDQLDSQSFKANEFIFEQTDDNSKAVEDLKSFLDKGDAVFTETMLDDIEEARLYQKRFKTPSEALVEASKVYQRSVDSALF